MHARCPFAASLNTILQLKTASQTYCYYLTPPIWPLNLKTLFTWSGILDGETHHQTAAAHRAVKNDLYLRHSVFEMRWKMKQQFIYLFSLPLCIFVLSPTQSIALWDSESTWPTAGRFVHVMKAALQGTSLQGETCQAFGNCRFGETNRTSVPGVSACQRPLICLLLCLER